MPDLDDFEALPEITEEWPADQSASGQNGLAQDTLDLTASPDLLKAELAELRTYAALAADIRRNSKGDALLEALKTGLAKAVALGAAPKAVVFTESRRTQQYLFDLLTDEAAGRWCPLRRLRHHHRPPAATSVELAISAGCLVPVTTIFTKPKFPASHTFQTPNCPYHNPRNTPLQFVFHPRCANLGARWKT